MGWDPWEPIGGKKQNSFFEPVSWDSGAGSSSWGYSATTTNKDSASWAYQSGSSSTNNNQNSGSQSSWAFQTPSGSNANGSNWFSPTSSSLASSATNWAYSTPGHQKNSSSWGFANGYGYGDHLGFGNDHHIQRLENHRQSSWGWDDGTSWHFSNAARDLDVHHTLQGAYARNDANGVFGSSWGYGSTKGWGETVSMSPSSFNPFAAGGKKSGWGWD